MRSLVFVVLPLSFCSRQSIGHDTAPWAPDDTVKPLDGFSYAQNCDSGPRTSSIAGCMRMLLQPVCIIQGTAFASVNQLQLRRRFRERTLRLKTSGLRVARGVNIESARAKRV